MGKAVGPTEGAPVQSQTSEGAQASGLWVRPASTCEFLTRAFRAALLELYWAHKYLGLLLNTDLEP